MRRSQAVRVCTQINPLLQLGFRRRAVEVIAIQMCAASQRGSRCWRKTLARYGEAGPKRALCVEIGTIGQIISRTDSEQQHVGAATAAQRGVVQNVPLPGNTENP